MTAANRLVVFTGNLAHSVIKGIVELDRMLPDSQWLIVVHAPRKTTSRLLVSQWRNLRRNGWRWIPYQMYDLWARLTRSHQAVVSFGQPGGTYGREVLGARPNVRIVSVDDIHDARTLREVSEFAPDLGLSMAAPILRRDLFAIPRLGTVNLHKGKLPQYRGMPPAFWELWNGEQSVGCTVHRVDDKLDTGEIVRSATVPRSRYSTLRGLQLTLDESGVNLMCESVMEILSGTARFAPQAGNGTTYRKPTLAQFAKLRRTIQSAQPQGAPSIVSAMKDARSLALFFAWRLVLWRLATPRITVLLYHRVTDETRDNLTTGIAQFDRQMELLRRHCEVMPIASVLASASIPRSKRPLVAVTFDDGYLDNFRNSVPILVRHRIPAAFFVSTGIIGSDKRFPHDVRRGNPPVPVMTWEHLREMRDLGFTIGSHTVHHVDCAAEPEELVRTELEQSRDDLMRELGLKEVLFGYPYGGRHHMTPERLELVKKSGYRGCLSAYGGTNVGRVDPFNVLRTGIHWEFSDRAFLHKCLGI